MTVTVVKLKPTSPGARGTVKVKNHNLYKGKKKPPRKLLKSRTKNPSGRNNQGGITVWKRGGGTPGHIRIIDFKRNDKDGIRGKVERFEYDPNRSAYLALILYIDGERRYILAPKGLKVGDPIFSGEESAISPGNCLPLRNIPLGTQIHAIEMKPGKGAQLARSAGCSAQLLAKEGDYVTLRLSSREMRKIPALCRATVGEVDLSEHNLRKLGKAGASRHRNKRPNVRGVAMNPVDHPLGGGEGRSSGGRPSCSPWGLPKGKKTARNKLSKKFIVRGRKSNKDKRG